MTPKTQFSNRRRFLSAAAPLFTIIARAQRTSPPRILLRSSWQSVNIGDIGHTPGALALLEKHFPEAEIILWPGDLGLGARELLTAAYPRLRIAEGEVSEDGKPTTAELTKAWEQADLYLNGSGSGFPGSRHALAFRKATGKPVGVLGVSTDPISGIGAGLDPEGGTLAELRSKAARLPQNHLSQGLRYIIDNAAFFFCRDTISRDYLRSQSVKCPIVEFGPDAQLAMTLRNDARGLAFLAAHGLEPEKFICVIPRLRYTPYYRIRKTPRTAADDVRDAINNRTTASDHAGLREMISAYVKKTGNKVLACAEMTYQVEMAKEVLVDPLPEDVKRNVVWRDSYWLPDEAASVYSKAQAVVSVECHSPLIAYHNGTPAFYLRQPTDTCKGQMYADFGASEWLFEIEEASGARLWERLEAVHRNPARAKAKVKSIMAEVDRRYARMAAAVRAACPR